MNDIELGDFAEARRGLQQAMTAWTRVLGPSHPNVARATSALAGVLSRQGRDQEALAYYERALEIRRRALGPQHNLVALTLSSMAAVLERLGQLRLAIERSNEAVAIASATAIETTCPTRSSFTHAFWRDWAKSRWPSALKRERSTCWLRPTVRHTRPWPRVK